MSGANATPTNIAPSSRTAERRPLRAILWDVDGTLAETERDGHLVAMNAAFAELDVPWRWDERRYGVLLRVAGGYERLLFDMQSQPHAPDTAAEREALAQRIHTRKNQLYGELIAGKAVPLRPGVRELMRDCIETGVKMAVVTTTSRGNVEALLDANLETGWRRHFSTLVCAEDAPRKKPDSQAYEIALARLGLSPGEAVAVEDSGMGLKAAAAIGVPVVVARSLYFAKDDVSGALAVGPSLGSGERWTPVVSEGESRVGLEQISAWHRAWLVSPARTAR